MRAGRTLMHYRRRLLVLTMAMALAATGCAGPGASAESARIDVSASAKSSEGSPAAAAACEVVMNADGGLEPLANGFPSEPITISHHLPPSDAFGVWARQFEQAVRDISPVRILIEDREDFGAQASGTWVNLDYMRDQPGAAEGYNVGIATISGTLDLLVTEAAEEYGVTIEDMNWLGLFETTPYVMISRKDAPWGSSMEDFVGYAREHPGETKYLARGPGSGLDQAWATYNDAAGDGGIPVDVAVGGDLAEIAATIGAGEADVSLTIANVAQQFYEDGRVELLMVSGENPAPPPWDDVPTAQDVFGTDALPVDPWAVNRGMFVVNGVPECNYEWLRSLVLAAYDQEGFREQRVAIPGQSVIELKRDDAWTYAYETCQRAATVLVDAGLVHESADPDLLCNR